MLEAREMALRDDLKKWRMVMKRMIKELDKAFASPRGQLKNGVIRRRCLRKCLRQLETLEREIKQAIERQKYGVWIL